MFLIGHLNDDDKRDFLLRLFDLYEYTFFFLVLEMLFVFVCRVVSICSLYLDFLGEFYSIFAFFNI